MPDSPPAAEADDFDVSEVLLNLLFSHRMSWIQDFLRARSLASSGTKDDLRKRVEGFLEAGTVSTEDFVTLLDSIEGWGNQHGYLYRAPDPVLGFLSDQAKLKAKLKSLSRIELFNQSVPLQLPALPTLTTIQWSISRIRFVWVERRPWRKRIPDQDKKEGAIELDAYQRKMSRGIVSFSCDLTSGHSELLIQRLPSGENYAAERDKFHNLLSEFFDVEQLVPLKVSKAIKKFDQDPRIRKRACQYATVMGSGVTYTSRSSQEDVYGDPSIKKARDALGTQMAGKLGNFYAPLGDEHAAHFKLYAKDQRVGIFGELAEGEVRDVLAGIRKHCK